MKVAEIIAALRLFNPAADVYLTDDLLFRARPVLAVRRAEIAAEPDDNENSQILIDARAERPFEQQQAEREKARMARIMAEEGIFGLSDDRLRWKAEWLPHTHAQKGPAKGWLKQTLNSWGFKGCARAGVLRSWRLPVWWLPDSLRCGS